MREKVHKSQDEWRRSLSPEQFRITRMKGTERPFTGSYHDSKEPGIYRCVCCGNPLFRSEAKYDSGSGWPSFFEPIDDNSLRFEPDDSLGMQRIEVLCSRCDAHLGHVFDDGPQPSGKRFCMNSCALDLSNDGQTPDE